MTNKTFTIEECQEFALGNFLSEWPRNKSYDEIIEAMEDENDLDDESEEDNCRIILWEPFEHDLMETVAEYIETHLWSLTRFVGLEK